MRFPKSFTASGWLYEPKFSEHSQLIFNMAGDELPCLKEHHLHLPGWTGIELRTSDSLLGMEEPQPCGFYSYYSLLRKSKTRFLLVSEHSSLVNAVLAVLSLESSVSTPRVQVGAAVTHITHHPDAHDLCEVVADVAGYGRSLTRVVVKGDDLADTKFFREMLPRIQPVRMSLHDAVVTTNTVSISARGKIWFPYRGETSLAYVDSVLSYLSVHRFLDWGETK